MSSLNRCCTRKSIFEKEIAPRVFEKIQKEEKEKKESTKACSVQKSKKIGLFFSLFFFRRLKPYWG